MTGTLIDLIDRLNEVDVSDRFNPPTIYAEGGPHAVPTARAMICPVGDEGGVECPQDPSLSEVLMVGLANEAIQVWSNWRRRTPTRQDKFAAVMYYSQHDAYLPMDGRTR